jgi:subtilase family serine protease
MRTAKKVSAVILCTASLLLGAASARAQKSQVASRVVDAVDETRTVRVQGNVHPFASPANDRGAVADSQPMTRMLLLLQRSAGQDAALAQWMDAQQTKGSGNFHSWLTPEQFGTTFGPSDADILAVTDWLTQHGFQVAKVSAGRTTIEFSGNAAQVRSAFQTDIHKFVANGHEFMANTADPSIPAALAPVVKGIATLHNYPKVAQIRKNGAYRRTRATGQLTPLFTFPGGTNCSATPDGSTCVALGPADWSTIYNVPAAATGAGQSIVVVGQSNINITDIENFRSLFGLPANDPTVILNGPDPGILGPDTTDDEGESDLDLEWAGAIAPAAKILFVVTQSTQTNVNQITSGVDLSALYAVDHNLAPVISESYGACEAQNGSSGNQFYNSLWQQAAAQGITVAVATGDTGTAGCDSSSAEVAATLGLAVSGTASTPYNVAVGGTDFIFDALLTNPPNQYWSATNNGTTQASALSYIPETPWDNSLCAINFPTACTSVDQTGGDLTAGSGGISGAYTKPPFQTGSFGTALGGATNRAIPDISFFSGNGFNGASYIVCQSDATTSGAACSLSSPYSDFLLVGGTSAATPSFAAVMALVNQQTGQRQGNANYVLYGLAAKDPNYASGACNSATPPAAGCVFNDVVQAINSNEVQWNNSVACVSGSPNCKVASGAPYGILADSNGNAAYTAVAQYDFTSGLGSINVGNLLTKWTSFARTATSTALNGLTGTTSGANLSATVIVSPTPSGASGTETVALNGYDAGGNPTGSMGPFALNKATANITNVTNLLPVGTVTVKATYGGDALLAASTSNSVGFTVAGAGLTAQTQVYYSSFDANGNPSNPTTSSQNIPYGSPYVLQIAVTNAANGKTCGFNYPTTTQPYPCPTGTITLTDNGSALNDFPNAGTPNATNVAKLNNLGIAEDQPIQLSATVGTTSPGVHKIVAAYSGDPNYAAGSPSNTMQITISKGQTAVGVAGTSSGTNVAIQATIATQSNGLGPTGTVTFTNGSTSVGTASCTAGTTAITGASNTTGVNGTTPGTGYCVVTLNTTISALYPPPTAQPETPIGPMVLLAFALVLFLALARWMPADRRRAYAYASLVAFALLASAIVGCGGGGGSSGGTTNVTINVAYPGDVNYSSSSGSVTVTITQ